MKSVIYKFNPVIYPYPVLVTKDYDEDELKGLFYLVNNDNELLDNQDTFIPNPNTLARTLFVVSKKEMLRYVLIILVRPKYITDGTIAHEAYHATNMIASVLGFMPDDSVNDEPCAYLVGWIADCCQSVRKGKHNMNGERVSEI